MHGKGKYLSSDGKMAEGIFEKDNFVKALWLPI